MLSVRLDGLVTSLVSLVSLVTEHLRYLRETRRYGEILSTYPDTVDGTAELDAEISVLERAINGVTEGNSLS